MEFRIGDLVRVTRYNDFFFGASGRKKDVIDKIGLVTRTYNPNRIYRPESTAERRHAKKHALMSILCGGSVVSCWMKDVQLISRIKE